MLLPTVHALRTLRLKAILATGVEIWPVVSHSVDTTTTGIGVTLRCFFTSDTHWALDRGPWGVDMR